MAARDRLRTGLEFAAAGFSVVGGFAVVAGVGRLLYAVAADGGRVGWFGVIVTGFVLTLFAQVARIWASKY